MKGGDDVIEPRNEILSLLTHAGGCAGQMWSDGSGPVSARKYSGGGSRVYSLLRKKTFDTYESQ